MDLIWGLPFAGLLLSIAVMPLAMPRLWHRGMEWIALFWCAALLVPKAVLNGTEPAAMLAWHAILIDYLPLICLLVALYVAGGGILIDGGNSGTPNGNTALLAAGTLAAGVLGTTGAAIVLIRPLLRANAHRRRQAHLVVFFILLVANAGGGIAPLGPPLYIGFLRGVPFLWTVHHLAGPLLMVIVPLLVVFRVLDGHACRGDPAPSPAPLRVRGMANLIIVFAIVASVLLQAIWHPANVVLLGAAISPARLVGAGVCLGLAGLSMAITSASIRAENGFGWEPMVEVAVLFGGLFVTIAPVLDMLAQGSSGPLAPLLAVTTDHAGGSRPVVYFWLTGLMSGFLDNAPTYLMFFQQAGGDATRLANAQAATLTAISAGSVLFGGLSYIGNAPNMMIRAIAEHEGVRMPGFFAYVLIAAVLLLPGLLLVTLLLS